MEGVGKVLLVEESYYGGIVELVNKLEEENQDYDSTRKELNKRAASTG